MHYTKNIIAVRCHGDTTMVTAVIWYFFNFDMCALWHEQKSSCYTQNEMRISQHKLYKHKVNSGMHADLLRTMNIREQKIQCDGKSIVD